MGWADWMVVSQTLEEELEVERSVREINKCDDEEALKIFAQPWSDRAGTNHAS